MAGSSDNDERECVFCGAVRSEVEIMIATETAAICGGCIDWCASQKNGDPEPEPDPDPDPDPEPPPKRKPVPYRSPGHARNRRI